MTDDPATLLRGREADVPDADPRFLDRLHDQLAVELGLTVRRFPTPAPSTRPIPIDARRRRIRWSSRTLLVAAILAGAAAALGVAGMSLVTPPPDDLLAAVRKAGVLRVEVDRTAYDGGFPSEVERRIGERIGIPVSLVEAENLVGPSVDGPWDLSIAGPTALVDSARFARSSAIFHWPAYVVTRSATRLVDLAGATICAVPGTAGTVWVEHPDAVESLIPVVPPPPGVRLALASSERECRNGLGKGWEAMVSADAGPDPLTGMGGLASVDASGTEARTAGFRADPVLITPTVLLARRAGPDPTTLLALVDDALAALRQDGSLSAMSRQAFAADLTDIPRSTNPDGFRTEPPAPVDVDQDPTAAGAPGGEHLLLMVVAPSAVGSGDPRASWGEFSFGLARLVAQRLREQGMAVNVRRIVSGVNIGRPVITSGRIVLQGPDWVDDAPGLRRSRPAYYWPVHLATLKEPGADPMIDQLEDLAFRTVCAVEGTPGAQWAAGDPTLVSAGPVATLPPGVNVHVEPTLEACGDGIGTRWFSWIPTQEIRSPFVGMYDWTVGGRPGPGGYVADPVFVHPVSFVVADAPGADELLREIDDALASLRADGTLLELSRSTLDGRDLVTPPEP